jgi:hypothetical protein
VTYVIPGDGPWRFDLGGDVITGTGAHCRHSVLEQHLTPALLQPIWAAPLLVLPFQQEPPCTQDLPLFNYPPALPLLTNEPSFG